MFYQLEALRMALMNKTNTPATIANPGKFVKHGSMPYKIMCYAKFKRGAAFTTTDYREFTLKRANSERVREAVNYLANIGYLTRHENTTPTHHQMKFKYALTLAGENCLIYLAQSERRRQEKNGIILDHLGSY